MQSFFKKVSMPGAFYRVTIESDFVTKKRRGMFGLLFFQVVFVDLSIKNIFNTLLHPRKKLDEIRGMFRMEQNVVRDVSAHLIGYVRFTETGYVQKRVSVFKDVSDTDEEYVSNFIKWIAALQELWTYGYHDTSMNFDINCGFDSIGNCVLFDFNEFTDDFEIALHEVRTKKWYNQHPFWKSRFIGNQDLRLRILEIINQELTPEALKKLWKTNKKTT